MIIDAELDSASVCPEKLPSSFLARYCPQAFALRAACSVPTFFCNSTVTPRRLQSSPFDRGLWGSPATSEPSQQWRQHRRVQTNSCGQKNTEHVDGRCSRSISYIKIRPLRTSFYAATASTRQRSDAERGRLHSGGKRMYSTTVCTRARL